MTRGTFGAITNGNSGSAAHTHVVDLSVIGENFADASTTIGAVNINGLLTVDNVVLNGDTTAGMVAANRSFFAPGSHNWKTVSVVTLCEFNSGTTITFGNASQTLYVLSLIHISSPRD